MTSDYWHWVLVVMVAVIDVEAMVDAQTSEKHGCYLCYDELSIILMRPTTHLSKKHTNDNMEEKAENFQDICTFST